MFWGCFLYDCKRPCHIWRKETVKENRRAQATLDSWNEEVELECQLLKSMLHALFAFA
jgi:hypothetical protein